MIKSKVLYTEEIDDMQLASEELFQQAEGFELEKSSFGLIFMDVETEYDELYRVLKEKWDIPFVGVTAIGMLTGRDGYCKSGISVMLLTSSDCRFAVGMTQGLTADDYREPVRKTIETLEKELEGE